MSINFNNRFILVDGTQAGAFVLQLIEFNPNAYPLFENTPDEDIKVIGPYLFQNTDNLEFYKFLQYSEGSNHWCIHCISNISITQLVKHFKQFLVFEETNGDNYFFRFYDPVVLKEFLLYWNTDQLKQFFGPVTKFICQEDGHDFAIVYELENGKLKISNIPGDTLFPILNNNEQHGNTGKIRSDIKSSNSIQDPDVNNNEQTQRTDKEVIFSQAGTNKTGRKFFN